MACRAQARKRAARIICARFATEQTITVNTAAAGGNAALMAQEEE